MLLFACVCLEIQVEIATCIYLFLEIRINRENSLYTKFRYLF